MRQAILLRGLVAPVVMAVMLLASPVRATELPNNQPVNDEAALLRKLDAPQLPPRVQGFVHIQDQKAGVLIQPAGRVFRDIHAPGQFWIDAALIVVAVLSMAGLYLAVGSMHVERDPRGRSILRSTVSSGSSTGWWRSAFSHWR